MTDVPHAMVLLIVRSTQGDQVEYIPYGARVHMEMVIRRVALAAFRTLLFANDIYKTSRLFYTETYMDKAY